MRKEEDERNDSEVRGMDLKDLKFFIAVYELKSFSNAANVLCTVPSNVSARILGLEEWLGERLFERRWRSIVPTSRADELYAEAKELIAAVERAARKFRVSQTA